MSKTINLCQVPGVTYVTDKNHGISVQQMGKYHLLVKTQTQGYRVRLVSPSGVQFDGVDVSERTEEPGMYLISTDGLPSVIRGGWELLIVGPDVQLAFEIKGAV